MTLRTTVRKLLRRDESDVLIGKDGWLFLKAGSNNVLDQHTGRRRMPPEDVEAWHGALAERVEWARARGITYRAIFVPDSQAVYRDKLPDRTAAQLIPDDQRPVPAMIASLPPALRDAVLYPLDELRAANARDETFQRGDTHWTEYGSWVVYNALKDSLDPDPAIGWIAEDRLSFHAASEWGDLGSKLDPPQMTLCLRAEVSGADATCTFDNKIRNNGHVRVYRRSAPTETRCLVFADSFARNIEKFLVNTFAETVLVHSSRRFDFEFAETVAPDIVLTLGVERFAIDPPHDRDGQSLTEVIAAKQAAGTTTGPAVGAWPWP